MTNAAQLIHDFRGTVALMNAADKMIGFERSVVEADDSRPFTMYRCYTDANGEPQMVVVARGTCSGIEDLGLFENEAQEN